MVRMLTTLLIIISIMHEYTVVTLYKRNLIEVDDGGGSDDEE
jgi:hypothetical protein